MPYLCMMRDIENTADIERLMSSFYDELLQIPDMQPVFAGIDMVHHLPRIVQFWAFVLLDEQGYSTNVFDKHLPLPIQSPQFDTWLAVFTSTVDRLFSGEKADLAKQRATVLAYTFKNKWEHLKGKGEKG